MKKIFSLKIDNVVIGLLVFATLASGGILASVRVKADANNTTVVDEISVVIPVSCSMLGTVTSAHTDTVTAVSYTENIGITDLKVTCNDFNGFSLYAVGFTGNTEGTTTMVGTNPNFTIPTGVHHQGDTASSWAMKLNKVTNPGGGDPDITYNPDILNITNGYSNYNVIPSSLTQVVEYKDNNGGSSATDQTLGAHVQTTYAAYVSGNQMADTYTGQVKYVLVHPANFATGTYNIAYNANGGSGSMTGETGIHNYEPFTLPASTFTPPNDYIFAGWCTVQDGNATAQSPQTTCTGDSYADQGTVPASTVAAGGTLNLYAYWKVPPTMQNVATWKSDLSIGQEITVPDTRDGKTYTVAKLADGNIWMTQNLDHDIGDVLNHTYTPANTDLPQNTSWTPSSSEYTKQTNDTTWNYSATTPESYNPGTLYWNGSLMPTNQADCEAGGGTWRPWQSCEGINLTSSTGNSHYHLGNYYNWTAAIAMSDSSSYTANNTDVDQSICPAGWMLPKSGNTLTGSGSFIYLKNEADLSAGTNGNIHTTPNWFVYGDDWGGSLGDVGNHGSYWSSVVASSNTSFLPSFDAGGNLYPQDSNTRYVGYSVRCVAR